MSGEKRTIAVEVEYRNGRKYGYVESELEAVREVVDTLMRIKVSKIILIEEKP